MLNEKGGLILRDIARGEKRIYFWSKIALNVISLPPPADFFFPLKKAKTIRRRRTKEMDSNKSEKQCGLVSIYFGLNQQIT